jgi:hypothetical protein
LIGVWHKDNLYLGTNTIENVAWRIASNSSNLDPRRAQFVWNKGLMVWPHNNLVRLVFLNATRIESQQFIPLIK